MSSAPVSNQPEHASSEPRSTTSNEQSFLESLSIAERLLQELCEPSGNVNSNQDGDNRPAQSAAGDVAGMVYQDFLLRSLQQNPTDIGDESEKVSNGKQSLRSIVQRHAFSGSAQSASQPSLGLAGMPNVGEEFLGFRLRQQLGEGAFAQVFLAEQAELAGRPVALKISDLSGTEPQTLAQLQHTHIVPIYSVHEVAAANLRAVCMPYFGGASLSQVLRIAWADQHPKHGIELVAALEQTSGPAVETFGKPNNDVPAAHAAQSNAAIRLKSLDYVHACMWIAARVAEGLQHAHDRGVLHRDIKPSNILLGADGTPMLLDFNLAHDENQDRAQLEATLGGTIAYMSPEHLRALITRDFSLIRNVDERSDIYSLGMVLYEMLAGQKPFEHTGNRWRMPVLIEAMAAERGRYTPSIRKFRDDAPWGLESILRKCLDPDPARRYQRADQLAEDLDRLLSDRPLRYAPELSRSEQARKWIRRHPRLASTAIVTLAASLLLTAGGLLLAATHSRLTAAQKRAYEAEGAEAREQKRQFEQGTLRALCLVNTHSDMEQHTVEGRDVCEKTLGLYKILDDPNWQQSAAWRRLSPPEQQKLAEDARQLLLLLAGAQTHLAGDNDTAALKNAIKLLERAEQIPGLPSSAPLLHARAEYLRKLGDEGAARAAEQQANSFPPGSAQDFYLLATADLQSAAPDRYRRAVADLEQALHLDPRHYWAWMQKGLCHLQLDQCDQALADFGVCIGLWPEFAWGYFNRGFTFDRLGKKSAAVSDYRAALERDGNLTEAKLNRGLAQLEMGHFDRALADFDELTQYKPGPALNALRAQALEGLKRFPEADAAFDAAFSELDTLPQKLRNQIRCAYGFAVSARLPERARQAFEQVPNDDPKYADAVYGLGMLQASQNHILRAVELFNQALEVRPGFEQVRRFRAILLARLGRLGEAEDDINLALQMAPRSGPTLYAAACVMALSAGRAASTSASQQAIAQAVQLLKESLDQGYGQQAASDPDLANLKDNGEFQQLLQSLQLNKVENHDSSQL